MSETVLLALAIPPLTPAEAIELERGELERFIQAVAALSPEAWSLPVTSSRGDIHALVAHVTGAYAAQARLSELWRQTNPQVLRLYRMEGDSIADTVARVQTGDRAHRSSSELLEELRTVGPVAIEHRKWAFRPLQIVSRAIGDSSRFPNLPLSPFRAVRDLWYHRLDVAEAAGVGMRIDSQHDGRVLALLARAGTTFADGQLGARTVDLMINGLDQARWRFGLPSDPDAVIVLDPIGFAKLVARHRSPAATRERAQIEGEVKTAMLLLTALHRGRQATR